MTLGHRVVLPLLALLSVAILVWRADTHAVRVAVLEVGWGIVLVVGQEVVAHLLNTLGWRFAFAREHVASLSFGELLRLRLAGDAINYLTPSATIAGEYARVAMLGDRLGADVRAASVVVAATITIGNLVSAREEITRALPSSGLIRRDVVWACSNTCCWLAGPVLKFLPIISSRCG